jgi:demethylmacrocin O-methyltransferase
MVDILAMVKANRSRYNTDKIAARHTYEGLYNRIINEILSRKDNPVVLEIGVQHGGSIRLWSDIFPKGIVIGAEISDKWRGDPIPDNAIQLIGNAYTDAVSEKVSLKAPLDLVIDDGPHNPETQAECVRRYAPMLAPGGVIVIEDIIHDWWIAEIHKQIPEGFTTELYDNRKHQCLDDMCLIIRKPM